MTETTPISQPLLIVVAGRPGAGKTSLAHALARAVRCPAICRDEIKEGFVNTIGRKGQPGDIAERGVYETFFDTVTLLLNRRVTLVAEAAFQHKLWAPKLEPLREIARVRIVVCTVDPALARSRHVERGLADPARERFHHDRAMHADREGRELPIGEYDPPRIDVPTLTVDTSDGYRDLGVGAGVRCRARPAWKSNHSRSADGKSMRRRWCSWCSAPRPPGCWC
jgi:predicted kinase